MDMNTQYQCQGYMPVIDYNYPYQYPTTPNNTQYTMTSNNGEYEYDIPNTLSRASSMCYEQPSQFYNYTPPKQFPHLYRVPTKPASVTFHYAYPKFVSKNQVKEEEEESLTETESQTASCEHLENSTKSYRARDTTKHETNAPYPVTERKNCDKGAGLKNIPFAKDLPRHNFIKSEPTTRHTEDKIEDKKPVERSKDISAKSHRDKPPRKISRRPPTRNYVKRHGLDITQDIKDNEVVRYLKSTDPPSLGRCFENQADSENQETWSKKDPNEEYGMHINSLAISQAVPIHIKITSFYNKLGQYLDHVKGAFVEHLFFIIESKCLIDCLQEMGAGLADSDKGYYIDTLPIVIHANKYFISWCTLLDPVNFPVFRKGQDFQKLLSEQKFNTMDVKRRRFYKKCAFNIHDKLSLSTHHTKSSLKNVNIYREEPIKKYIINAGFTV